MLICPELKKVFILVPRTGSGTLYREICRVYPKSMLLYRHMEADGCPRGYDMWERIGVVRHPLYRLWSLYHFLKEKDGVLGASTYGSPPSAAHTADTARKKEQVQHPFSEWLLNNREPFMHANDQTGHGAFWPILTRNYPAPENCISQYQYLRPDLGTTIWKFENLKPNMARLGLDFCRYENMTMAGERETPPWTPEIDRHLRMYHRWDLDQNCIHL